LDSDIIKMLENGFIWLVCYLIFTAILAKIFIVILKKNK